MKLTSFLFAWPDPEHDYTLETLKVVKRKHIEIAYTENMHCHISIQFTPTVPHCTLATTIGLCIREKLRRELPVAAKVRGFEAYFMFFVQFGEALLIHRY